MSSLRTLRIIIISNYILQQTEIDNTFERKYLNVTKFKPFIFNPVFGNIKKSHLKAYQVTITDLCSPISGRHND